MLPKLRTSLVCTIALILTATAPAQNTIHVPSDQPTIQAGINAANTGDTVLVAPGTYPENLDFEGKAITVQSSAGPGSTTINGGQNTATVTFQHGETRSSILNGFTVTGGKGNYEGTSGGIYLSATSPTITNNVITANNCYGINSQASGPLIQNNTISGTLDSSMGNCGFAAGAGIWIAFDQELGQQTPSVIGNIIESNLYSGLEDAGGNGGGGIAIWGGNPVIENNIIRNNKTGEAPGFTAGGEGGGIFINGGGGLIVQNLIYGNMASYDGGGIAIESYLYGIGPIQLAFVNNTIVDNSVVPYDSPITSPGGQQVLNDVLFEGYAWINNIIAGSTTGAAFVCQDILKSQPPSIFENNDLYNASGPLTGNFANSVSSTCTYPLGSYGNISSDPLFNQAATHDYRLASGSPAIDTGTNSGLQLATSLGATPIATDLVGNARIQNATVAPYPVIDMGAYEAAGPTSPEATTMLLTPSLYEAPGYGSIDLTAKLLSPSGTPTGSVTFTMDGITLTSATIDSTGSASIPVTRLVPGIHSFAAKYPGQGSFTPASSIHIYVFVDKYQTTLTATSSPNPSLVGQLVTFTATISSPEGGAPSPITFTDEIDPSNPVQLASITPDSNGVAVFTTSSLSTGNHPFDIAYAGDATHTGAGTYVTQDVSYASTSVLSVSPTTAAAGAGITLTATVSAASPPAAGTPTGTVNFFETSAAFPGGLFLNFATLNSRGVASITLNYITTGTITCIYNGDYNYAVSNCNSVPVTITSTPLTPSTAALTVAPTTAKAGTPINLTATISSAASTGPSPTGTVSFTETVPPSTTPTTLQTIDLTADNAALPSSIASLSLSNLSTGVLGCTYSGDTTYAASTCNSVPITVASSAPSTTTTTLAITAGGASVTSVSPGTVVTLTATTLAGSSPVSPGQVNFCDATAPVCTDIHLLGIAQLTPAGTAAYRFIPGPGTHSYKAVFLGTQSNTTSSSAAEPLAVGPTASNATTTTLSATGVPGDYTLTAVVSGAAAGAPTGTVSFLDMTNSNYVLATASLTSSASGLNLVETPLNPTGLEPANVVTADFNGDGILDFAVPAADSLGEDVPGSLLIFFGKGDGTFTAGPVIATGTSPGTLVTGDFNADGTADLAYSTLVDGNINVLLGKGDGTFTPAPNPIQGNFADVFGLVVGDFNNDGNLDLVYDDAQTRKVVVLLGNGDGTFNQVVTQSNTGDNPTAIVAGDFNRDGRLDLAVDNLFPSDGSLAASNLTILLGNGDGTFSPAPSVPVGVGPEGLVMADFNGDGKLDLAVANIQPPATVTVYLGNGDGTFSGPASTLSIDYLNALSVGDFNGDGIPDIATTEAVGDAAPRNATILLGKGDGTFTFAYGGDGALIPQGVTAADFNGDGLSDLAVPSQLGGVAVFLSTVGPTATATVANISPVGTGPHLVDATYPGDSTYAASLSNTVTLTAQRVPTSVTLTAATALSGPVTLTAALSPNLAQNHAATGLVTFSSNGNILGTANISNGVADLSISSLPVGLDPLLAQYAGDTNFAPSSGTGSVVTTPPALPDFTFLGPPSVTFRTEADGVATLTLTSLNGFAGPLSITCNAPLPPNYLCTLSHSSVALAANNTSSLTLTLHPNLHHALSLPPGFHRPGRSSAITFASLLPVSLLALYQRRRRRALRSLLLLLCLGGWMTALTACGSDIYYAATPPGTYPISLTAAGTVQGSSTSTVHTLSINAVITP